MRVRLLASLGSLVLHALALGAVILGVRVPLAADDAPPAIVMIEMAPANPRHAPRAREGAPRAAAAPPTQDAPQPMATATLMPISDALAVNAQTTPPSQAEQDAYVRAVWRHLAAHRPRGSGAQRTARIVFALNRDGGLRYAFIDRSSGSAAFDSACLRTVRIAAPYPSAPAGASEHLLVFAVPYSTQP
ncbi:energy transducer TonB [Terricaulis sp.]|uniref:energy transducer TonB n=1 Tax=Terricaulis sp. TaxID=2768686 RepID=UPI003783C4CE